MILFMPVKRAAKLRVVLNDRAVQRFVPRVPPGGVLLGVVTRGMHIGALARLQSGAFVQVNGDVIQPLNRSQVEAALRRTAPDRARAAATAAPASSSGNGSVIVTIKRRRSTSARGAVSSAAIPGGRR